MAVGAGGEVLKAKAVKRAGKRIEDAEEATPSFLIGEAPASKPAKRKIGFPKKAAAQAKAEKDIIEECKRVAAREVAAIKEKAEQEVEKFLTYQIE